MRLVLAATILLTLNVAAFAQPTPNTGGGWAGSGQLSAYVLGSGILYPERSKGTLPCTGMSGTCKVGTGSYRVRFARQLPGCSYTASIAATYFGFVSVIGNTDPNTVEVRTANTSGVAADLPFIVQVLC